MVIPPIVFVAILMSSQGLVRPSVHVQPAKSNTATIHVVYPILNSSIDPCNDLTFGLSSCSISLSVNVTYIQQVTIQIQNNPDQLQRQV